MRTRRALPGPFTWLVAVVLVALLVGAAAGCGGDDDDDAEPPTTDESQAEGPCALLTVDQVSDLFGEDAQVVPPAGGATASNMCLWEATSGDGNFPTRHQLQLQVFEGGGELDPRSYGDESESVDDLGDQAFVVPQGAFGTTAGYRDGLGGQRGRGRRPPPRDRRALGLTPLERLRRRSCRPGGTRTPRRCPASPRRR